MADILHQITIDAPVEKLFEAVTTQEGLSGWWTSDVNARPEEGSIAEFGFQNHEIVFRMRIEKLSPSGGVEWTCLGDVDEWSGTRLFFDFQPQDDGRTVVKFVHSGWRSTQGAYPVCNTDWGRLMYYLKDYAEGRGKGPMMS